MEAALTKIKGVKSAKVSNQAKSAKVVFEPGKTDPQKIVKAFNQGNGGGYKAAVAKPQPGRLKGKSKS